MRIILFTGKGGVGKTSVAAATAVDLASSGMRTLITSTDPAHSLGDSLECDVGSAPTEVMPRLWAQQIDAQAKLEESWREIQGYAVDLLQWSGMSGIEAEELSVIPGLDELFSLADIKAQYQSREFDVVIVDCAPTAETLRLLSLPEVISWYIERIFPVERKIVKAVRPVLARIKSAPPIASESVLDAVERFYTRIEGIKAVLTDPDVTSIRLVVNPEKMVIEEAKRTFTYLCLFGYRVDAVVINRVLPSEVQDQFFDAWKKLQADHIRDIERSFAPVPILSAPLFDREVVGRGLLRDLAAEIYRASNPAQILYKGATLSVISRERGSEMRLRLPFAVKNEIELSRKQEELFVKVGGFKRNLVLPRALQRAQIETATVEGDELVLTFGAAEAGGEA